MISSIAVRNYLSVLGDRGVVRSAVLADSGVDYVRVGEPGYVLEIDQYRKIVANILAATGDEGIGFELGIRPDLASLGVLGHAVSTCGTVRDTHRMWVRFGAVLVGNMGRLEVVGEDRENVTLEMASPEPFDPLYRFCVEEMLGLLHMIGKPLVGQTTPFRHIALSYPKPVHAPKYQSLFECPISFSAKQTRVQVSREWFDSPLKTHDTEFNSICIQHCESLYTRFEGSMPMTAALRNVFARQTTAPIPSVDEVASMFKMTPRTLRRRLHAEGTSYREEVEVFRAAQAKKLFSYGTVSPKEAAFLLGFKEQSAFRHAFKNWTGQSITEYRAAVEKTA